MFLCCLILVSHKLIEMSACVYVIHADNGEVKVGLSGGPYSRLYQVKKDYAHRRGFSDAYLVGFVTTDYGVIVESLAIDSLIENAVGGEWFKIHPLIALNAVIEAASFYDDNLIIQTVGPKDENKVSKKILRKIVREKIPGYRV
jgi:hypothetical protein